METLMRLAGKITVKTIEYFTPDMLLLFIFSILLLIFTVIGFKGMLYWLIRKIL